MPHVLLLIMGLMWGDGTSAELGHVNCHFPISGYANLEVNDFATMQIKFTYVGPQDYMTPSRFVLCDSNAYLSILHSCRGPANYINDAITDQSGHLIRLVIASPESLGQAVRTIIRDLPNGSLDYGSDPMQVVSMTIAHRHGKDVRVTELFLRRKTMQHVYLILARYLSAGDRDELCDFLRHIHARCPNR